jgi:hypothetical protein
LKYLEKGREDRDPFIRRYLLGASSSRGTGATAALGGFAGGHGESADSNDSKQDDVFHSISILFLFLSK